MTTGGKKGKESQIELSSIRALRSSRNAGPGRGDDLALALTDGLCIIAAYLLGLFEGLLWMRV
jgi:hypothetical protein